MTFDDVKVQKTSSTAAGQDHILGNEQQSHSNDVCVTVYVITIIPASQSTIMEDGGFTFSQEYIAV